MKFYMLAVAYVHVFACIHAMSGREKQCEPNRASLCQNLYNETHFPRSPHQSQEDAILGLNEYKELISTRCAKHLRLFLCSFFIPMCTILDEPLKPCRSLCEEVRQGCEKVIFKYVGLKWPYQLRCGQFKEYGSDLCIGNAKPTKIKKINRVQPSKRTKVFDYEKIILQCPESKKINFKRINHQKHVLDSSNQKHPICSRSSSQQALRKLCNSEIMCEFQLSDITNKLGQPTTCKAGHVGPSIIKYYCVEESQYGKQLVLHYGQDENLYCKSNSRYIHILKVQFKDDTCITPNAFCSVTQSCTGKQNCVLWASDHYIPSQCKSETMKLTVVYDCLKAPFSTDVMIGDLTGPNSEIKLQCPEGKMLKISRAEYLNVQCNTKNIHCAVNIQCDKKPSCIIDRNTISTARCTEGSSKFRIRYLCT